MKKYLKELIILIVQLFMFYISPLFAHQDEMIGMVLLMIIVTFILSVLMGVLSNNKIKYIYPVVVSLIFIPSIFIYYNESALIHSVWYLIITLIGVTIGAIVNKVIK